MEKKPFYLLVMRYKLLLCQKNFMVQLAILSTSGSILEVLKSVTVDDTILYDADELII